MTKQTHSAKRGIKSPLRPIGLMMDRARNDEPFSVSSSLDWIVGRSASP